MSNAKTTEIDALKAAVELPRIVAETLALSKVGRDHVGLCPFHNERTPSFTVFVDHYHCFGCAAHGDVLDWLVNARRMRFRDAIRYLAGGGSGVVVLPTARPQKHQQDDQRLKIARMIWQESTPPVGSPAEAYLHSRGLELPDEPVIRFHPDCPCGDRRLPAMIALMTDPVTGEPRGIHSTFLRPDGSGKADIEKKKQKMMLGRSGVIRLCEPETKGLGISEGIETGLAVVQRVGWGPVWATGSAGGIRNFPTLIERTLHIFVDHDEAGMPAAEHCAERWAADDLEVWIHVPEAGEDWANAAERITP
jgi:putative DNA primase/helicase